MSSSIQPRPPPSPDLNLINDSDHGVPPSEVPLTDKKSLVQQGSLKISNFLHRDKTGHVPLSSFKQLDKGAVKVVWITAEQMPPHPQNKNIPEDAAKKVFFTAVKGMGRESELRGEVISVQTIGKTIETLGGNINNLALDYKESKMKIDGKFTVETSKAEGSLEKLLKDPDKIRKGISFDERFKLVGDIFEGGKNLHLTGNAHGDLKAENVLVYKDDEGNLSAKVADFGKTKPGTDPQMRYVGNPRHVAPEGKHTTQGDTFGFALIAIRLLEEGIMQKGENCLLRPREGDFREEAAPNYRGVEKYSIEHQATFARNKGDKFGNMGAYYMMGKRSPEEMGRHQEAIHDYIDVLTERLTQSVGRDKAINISILLKSMTVADPSARFSMAEASEMMRQILTSSFDSD